MLTKSTLLAVASVTLLAACSDVQTTRSTPLRALPSVAPVQAAPLADYKINRVRVVVPSILSVSEANKLLPPADIVWREDPYGDRRAQVQAIVDKAVRQGLSGMHGREAVNVDITVRRFHALSQMARTTVGGNHNIQFDMVIRDAQSGRQIGETAHISASLKAFGGKRALAAEKRGETQKVRISRHISAVMKQYFQL